MPLKRRITLITQVTVEIQPNGDQVWDLRVEMKRGGGRFLCYSQVPRLMLCTGKTRGYPVIAPRATF